TGPSISTWPSLGEFPRQQASPRASNGEGFCRDKVAMPQKPSGAHEGTCTIVFLGAHGASVEVEAPKDGYILDAGLNAGLELPFTCRGGICGACVGRVTEGEVDASDIADVTFTLNEEEVEGGMTLLCMSRPISDRLVVETQSDWGYSIGDLSEWKGPTGEILGKRVQPLMGKAWETAKQE
ncbi:hypothetical protein APUTEX25_000018, partial [Auxenochlorella protothecoides]